MVCRSCWDWCLGVGMPLVEMLVLGAKVCNEKQRVC